MIESASARRQVRAKAARSLLSLHEQDALADPDRWTFELIDRLPLWCLMDTDSRQRIQRVAGAVLLAPEMRLWISAAQLAEAEQLLGSETLAAILERADKLAVSAQADDASASDAVAGPGESRASEGLQLRLMSAGASVLGATLHESLPLQSLASTLGTSAGELPQTVALHVLSVAQDIVAQVDSELVGEQATEPSSHDPAVA